MKKICILLLFTMIIGTMPCYAARVEGEATVGSTLSAEVFENVTYPEFGIGRIEAEEMHTSGYFEATSENASGGKYIKIHSDQAQRGGVWGFAGFRYNGNTVKCSINIAYPDFYSGASPKHLYINGERIAMWSGKITYGLSVWGTKPEYTKESVKIKTIDDVMLKKGDIVTFVSKPDYGEYGELDYIEISRSTSGSAVDDEIFSDIENDINKEKILKLEKEGIISASSDRKFNPERIITRAEFIVMLDRMLGYINIKPAKDGWAKNYTDKAVVHGWVNSSDDFSLNTTGEYVKDILDKVEYISEAVVPDSGEITRSIAAGIIYDAREQLEAKKNADIEMKTEYELDSQGYIKTWLFTGEVITHVYEGPDDDSIVMQQCKTFPLEVKVPDRNYFSSTLENGMDFNVRPMGTSGFVYELVRGGDPQLGFMDAYLCCDIIAAEKCNVQTKIVASRGYYDVYLNGQKQTDLYWFWTRNTDKTFTMQLEEGINRMFIRIQGCKGNMHTTNVGIQLLDNKELIKTTVPDKKDILASVNQVEDWIYKIELDSNGNLKAPTPPGEGAVIMVGNESYDWPLYSDTFDFMKEYKNKLTDFKLKTKVGDNYIERQISIPYNYETPRTEFKTLSEHQENYLNKVLENEVKDWDWSEYVLFRLNAGYELTETDISRIRSTIDSINTMGDCAEFAMTHLMRVYLLYGDVFPQDLKDEIKACMINFGYFEDEEGTATMIFTSENHKIGAHTCQYIAGSLFPEEKFLRSNRTGSEQMRVASERLDAWFDKVENNGFEEFGSPDYYDITLNSLLNCYDFVDNDEFKQRAKNAIDLMLRTAALTSFDGVSAGANGRVYGHSLMYSMKSEKSKILSYLSPSMNFPEYTQQVLGLATSSYTPPADLEELITGEAEMSYLQGGTRLSVKKTKDYIISSLEIPTPATGELSSLFAKGILLYQPHLWEASLSAKAKVFVTNPGTSSESAETRPGYWFGEYCAPVIKMDGNTVMEIYNIPETAGIQFTHAYFTTDDYDEVIIEDNRLFGRKNDGYVSLWCSSPLEKRSDLTINTEYRANNPKTAWVCTVSSKAESGSFEEFVAAQKAKNLDFNETKLKLTIDGNEVLSW